MSSSSGDESEENHPLFDGDLSIPSPTDNRSKDPSFSYSFKDTGPVPACVTRGEGAKTKNTGVIHLQQPLRRF